MIINYEIEDDCFDYDVDVSEFIREKLNALSKKELIDLILQDLDCQDDLEIYFEPEIYFEFKSKAIEEYKDYCEYSKNPLSYYGMSKKDF